MATETIRIERSLLPATVEFANSLDWKLPAAANVLIKLGLATLQDDPQALQAELEVVFASQRVVRHKRERG